MADPSNLLEDADESASESESELELDELEDELEDEPEDELDKLNLLPSPDFPTSVPGCGVILSFSGSLAAKIYKIF